MEGGRKDNNLEAHVYTNTHVNTTRSQKTVCKYTNVRQGVDYLGGQDTSGMPG